MTTWYHVSPRLNRRSIRRAGLLTALSYCAGRRIYLVDDRTLVWAVAHVRARHRLWPQAAVDVWAIDGRHISPRRCTVGVGTAYIQVDVPPTHLRLHGTAYGGQSTPGPTRGVRPS